MYSACCLDELTLETSVMDTARKQRHIFMTKLFRKPSLYEGHKKKSVIWIWESLVMDEGDLVMSATTIIYL